MKTEKKVTPAVTTKKVISVTPRPNKTIIQLKTETPKVRCLKIQPFFRESQSRCYPKPKATIVPELRLCGLWLQQAGLHPDNYASIIVMDGLIIIRPAPEHLTT